MNRHPLNRTREQKGKAVKITPVTDFLRLSLYNTRTRRDNAIQDTAGARINELSMKQQQGNNRREGPNRTTLMRPKQRPQYLRGLTDFRVQIEQKGTETYPPKWCRTQIINN